MTRLITSMAAQSLQMLIQCAVPLFLTGWLQLNDTFGGQSISLGGRFLGNSLTGVSVKFGTKGTPFANKPYSCNPTAIADTYVHCT